jgi:7,8-dihydropterin-6-yl-methyl-4-(beta-D-ribofuranosyl)aminobenzene 5'-phosphate synthase
MRITIVYDNEIRKPGLIADHGFSCLIEAPDTPRILFDTGASGSILLNNMKELKIDPSRIDMVVISHPHWDHFGGLEDIIKANQDIEIYLPQSFGGGISARKITTIKQPSEIRPGIFTTGELGGTEQSLVIDSDKGLVVVVGCAHPGVGNILDTAARFGQVYGIVGGVHGFHDFDRLNPLSLICPCHCTQYKSEIKRLFPDRCLDCGAGLVLEL